jgi:beta-glucosidase/6-phospho-beta-glucosidase/beta-galactosidase
MLRDYNKPLMITEFGSMSAVNPPADKEETQTGHPKYHERILREGYSGFYDNPEIVGYVPWSLMDVRVPMHWRWYNAGSGTFAYGAMDNDYNEKHVFGVIKEEITNLKDHFSE